MCAGSAAARHAASPAAVAAATSHFYLRPFRERKRLAGFRLDESKNRFVLLRVGYRYLDSFSSDPDEHRVVTEARPRYPLKGGVLVSNRARVDARFSDREYSWRFRSRLSVEKEFSIGPVRDESVRPGRAVLRQSVRCLEPDGVDRR
jgi:hypothetical protein